MRSYVLVNNKETYTLVKFSAQDFANDPVLYLQTDYLRGVKENFKKITAIQIFQNDISVGLYEIYDTYSDITDCGAQYNEDVNQFVDCLAVRLTKNNLAEQVQSLQDIVNPVIDFNTMSDEEIKTYKINEINQICTELIEKGVQIETDRGTETFSLEMRDQFDILVLAIISILCPTLPYLPYHSDTNICRLFPTNVIKSLFLQAETQIMKETTKCNALRTQLRNETDRDVILSYTYDTELKDEYAKTYNDLLTYTLNVVQQIINTLIPEQDNTSTSESGDSDGENTETTTKDTTVN